MTDTHTTTHIPDEAAQAAAEATKGIVPEDFLITALTAALPHLSMPCAVEVRPSSLVNAASILASDAPHIVVQKLDAAYSQIVTKPVDVAAVRRQAFEEALNAADLVKDNFMSEEYAMPQPIGSLSERFACDAVREAISALSTEPSLKGQQHDK